MNILKFIKNLWKKIKKVSMNLLIKKNKSKIKSPANNDNAKLINEIFKQKFGQDVPFVAEKINNYVIKLEKKEIAEESQKLRNEIEKKYKYIFRLNMELQDKSPHLTFLNNDYGNWDYHSKKMVINSVFKEIKEAEEKLKINNQLLTNVYKQNLFKM